MCVERAASLSFLGFEKRKLVGLVPSFTEKGGVSVSFSFSRKEGGGGSFEDARLGALCGGGNLRVGPRGRNFKGAHKGLRHLGAVSSFASVGISCQTQDRVHKRSFFSSNVPIINGGTKGEA